MKKHAGISVRNPDAQRMETDICGAYYLSMTALIQKPPPEKTARLGIASDHISQPGFRSGECGKGEYHVDSKHQA